MSFIDIHCHLDICQDIPQIIERCKTKKVNIILTCSIDRTTNEKSLTLHKKYPEVKACLGIFPSYGLTLTKDALKAELDFIKIHKDDAIAIGECGLDLHECKDIEQQKQILQQCVALAQELDKPIIIHSRKAEEETISFLETLGYKNILMHCFSGKKKLVQRIIDNGWFLSIPASSVYNEQFQEMIRMTPIEQLFCETDAPFLHPKKEQHNDPSKVMYSYETIARIKELPLEQVKEQIFTNYRDLFGTQKNS